jgi:potassium-transporting ATPase KdpC subunit
MKTHILPAVRLTLVCLVFFMLIYPLIVLGIAQFAPNKGKGEVINYQFSTVNYQLYANIGQKFTSDKYFYSCPSAADYNAAGSCGSNKGPSNPDYLAQVQSRIDTFLIHNPETMKSEIPSDLVCASGSGLDPHISVQAAKVQIKRIAKIRHISEGNLQQLVFTYTESPLFGLFGTEKVNVLKINLALESLR